MTGNLAPAPDKTAAPPVSPDPAVGVEGGTTGRSRLKRAGMRAAGQRGTQGSRTQRACRRRAATSLRRVPVTQTPTRLRPGAGPRDVFHQGGGRQPPGDDNDGARPRLV